MPSCTNDRSDRLCGRAQPHTWSGVLPRALYFSFQEHRFSGAVGIRYDVEKFGEALRAMLSNR
jgi:hypothetical protein